MQKPVDNLAEFTDNQTHQICHILKQQRLSCKKVSLCYFSNCHIYIILLHLYMQYVK